MGTSPNAAVFASKITKAGEALAKSTELSVKAGGDVMKGYIEAGGASATGGDLVLSHGARKGSRLSRGGKLGVRIVVKGSKNPVALVLPTGAWGIVERGAEEHLIGINARRGKSNKAKVAYLYAQGAAHPVKGPIVHPGTKGKHAWTIAKARGTRPTYKAMSVPPIKAVAGSFK